VLVVILANVGGGTRAFGGTGLRRVNGNNGHPGAILNRR